MATTDIPNLADSEFDGVRGQLLRAFLKNKRDLGPAYSDDGLILKRVDAIARVMLWQMNRALDERDAVWLRRFDWFVDLVNDLLGDLPDRLDG